MKSAVKILFSLVLFVSIGTSYASTPTEHQNQFGGTVIAAAITGFSMPKEHPVVLRFSGTQNDTLGILYHEGIFQHYTIEDEFRPSGGKVYGETRIPAGIYKLELSTIGTKHAEYLQKFPKFHRGMVHIVGVPGFDRILYHIGNSDKDTYGCILCGDKPNNNQLERGYIGESTNAYVRTYPKLAQYIERTPNPVIEIFDLDRS